MMTTTDLLGMLHQLQLTPTAIDVLSVMVAHQDPGGAVGMKQSEIDAVLGVGQASMSRAMGLLVDRGIVLRSGGGRGHRYALNPAVAGYESQDELEKEMTQQLAVGGPPPIRVPGYAKRPPSPARADCSPSRSGRPQRSEAPAGLPGPSAPVRESVHPQYAHPSDSQPPRDGRHRPGARQSG
ncbi:helix-turn-helix domain-containing protein [Streptomyces sp. RP5T]|uniref:helix-turn-helix domain-containing protein n=1 Tax=Streptomyces sp. RP5T TaxID=2490848 RepID=UPI000F64641F|nr:helix-turn-helix domain-containing protein [Streptomyces sp. RP5T]RRR87014.1 hypothetical protein EHS43_02625 [Streptomyces sp. RP5T]